MRGLMIIMGTMVLTIMTAITARSQDTCNEVLLIGFRDTYEKLNVSSVSSASSSWSCSAEAKDSATKTKVAIKIPLPVPDGEEPITIGGSFGSEQLEKWQKKHCGANHQSFDQDQSEKILVSVLSPIAGDAINAWSECKRQSSHQNNTGITAEIRNYSPTDGKFTLVMNWRNTPNQKRPNVQSIDFPNVNCIPAFPRSTWITWLTGNPVPDATYACTRHGDGRAIFTLNTDQGPLVPSPVLPAKPSKGSKPYQYFCRFTNASVGADHTNISERTKGMIFTCPDLPPGAHFKVMANGTIFPDYKSEGWSAGDNNGNVYWSVNLSLLIGEGGRDAVPKATFGASHIPTPTYSITIEADGKTPAEGADTGVLVELIPNLMSMWPDTHGPTGIKPDFTITVAVD